VPSGFLLERPLFGYRFSCDVSRNGPQRLLYLEGECCIIESRLLRGLLKPHFHVIDIGANVGYTTLPMASAIGDGGSIVAIEPSPENLPELRKNIEINSLSNRVEIIASAVGDAPGDVGLKGGINSGVVAYGEAPHRVHIDRLDNLVNKPIDFIKMEVEGYEVKAINGAVTILSAQRPVLFSEVHPLLIRSIGDSVERMIRTLQEIYSMIRYYEPGNANNIAEKNNDDVWWVRARHRTIRYI
jgi:FkbM family methyltransferase